MWTERSEPGEASSSLLFLDLYRVDTSDLLMISDPARLWDQYVGRTSGQNQAG